MVWLEQYMVHELHKDPSMKRLSSIFLTTTFLLSATLSGCAMPDDQEPFGDERADTTQAGTRDGEADQTPWSGFWWPMKGGDLVRGWDDGKGRKRWTKAEVLAFDNCLGSTTTRCQERMAEAAEDNGRSLSPLMKFDLYVAQMIEEEHGEDAEPWMYSHASKWEIDNHYIGNNTDHRFWDSRGFAGKCIGWALSTMFYDEPLKDVKIDGIAFRPADIKGILAAVFNGAQFFIPEGMAFGTEYRDDLELSDAAKKKAYDDVKPNEFVKALMLTIDKGGMLEADLDPGDGVWNYPIFKYELEYKRRSRARLEVTTTIHYADDEVEADEVFSTNRSRPDLKKRTYTFDLNVPSNWDGDLMKATGGKWTGQSVDNHPDVVLLGVEDFWLEEIYEYEDTEMNLELNFPLLILDTNGDRAVVLDLLDRYYARN
jgi:hypothetical protein